LVAVSLAASLALVGCGGEEKESAGSRTPSRSATPVPAAKGTNDAVMTTDPVAAQAPAASAGEAITRYLDAEIAGDFATSWALLSSEDRDDVGTFDAWRDQHSVAPRVTFSSVVSAPGVEPIVTETAFEPRIDETVGVVAGSARITWATVAEGGGFTVDRTGTKADAHYPAETLAAGDAVDWLERVRKDAPPIGYTGSLLGDAALVEQLVEDDGAYEATTTIELEDWATPELVANAFGPGANTWARIVHLDGATPFDAVMAPYGDRWVVVGVVPT